ALGQTLRNFRIAQAQQMGCGGNGYNILRAVLSPEGGGYITTRAVKPEVVQTAPVVRRVNARCGIIPAVGLGGRYRPGKSTGGGDASEYGHLHEIFRAGSGVQRRRDIYHRSRQYVVSEPAFRDVFFILNLLIVMKKYIISLTCLLSLGVTSCDDSQLDLINENTISTGNFWKTEQDAERGVVAVYGMFYRQGTWTRNIYTQMQGMADDGVSLAGWTELNEYAKFILPTITSAR
ncbi:MAG: hypothetical protein LRY55_13995, partial [Leadbetterella sp.]|nr:hypothetical protein [Leadbetterella sp.]